MKTIAVTIALAIVLGNGIMVGEADSAPIPPTGKAAYMVLANELAAKYAVPASEIKQIIKCESQWNLNAWNKSDPNGGSKGIMQFQEQTFYREANLATIKNPDIWNPEQQIEVGAYAISIGKVRQWSCASKLKLVK